MLNTIEKPQHLPVADSALQPNGDDEIIALFHRWLAGIEAAHEILRGGASDEVFNEAVGRADTAIHEMVEIPAAGLIGIAIKASMIMFAEYGMLKPGGLMVTLREIEDMTFDRALGWSLLTDAARLIPAIGARVLPAQPAA